MNRFATVNKARRRNPEGAALYCSPAKMIVTRSVSERRNLLPRLRFGLRSSSPNVPFSPARKPPRPRGIILVLVLVVTSVLTMACLVFAELMLNERRAAVTASRQVQTRVLAQSGTQLARQFLDLDPADQTAQGGLYDNPQTFQNVLIADEPAPQDRGHCSLIAPRISDDGTVFVGGRYGLQDESTRINLATICSLPGDDKNNTKAKAMLMALPGMLDEIADSILDWIDRNDTPRPNGAESDYYGTLSPPYSARNAAPVTLDELLLVRNMTPAYLYGLDAVTMGLIPADSVSGTSIDGVDDSAGTMDHGWAAYFTLWSAESNLKADGTQKTNLNGSDLQKIYNSLTSALDEQSASFVVKYRAKDPSKPIAQLQPAKQIASMLELITASVQHMTNPFTKDNISKLYDVATLQSGKSIPGRININQASQVVLMCLTSIPRVGLTPDNVNQIISNRVLDPMNAPADQHYSIWPYTEGIVSRTVMMQLEPYVCAGGSVYRAQVLGYFEKGSLIGRVEALLDSSQHPTKILFWRDMMRLPGYKFPFESLEEMTSAGTTNLTNSTSSTSSQ